MSKIVFPVLAGCVLLGSCGESGPDAEALPYGPVQQMMATEVQPTSEIFWNSMRFESELVDGEVVERDIKPESDEEWEKVRLSAQHLGELGKVLGGPYAVGRGDDWKDFSDGLVEVAAKAEQAARDKDPDAVFEVGGTVYNVCKACHQMYPPEDMPEAAEAEDAAN